MQELSLNELCEVAGGFSVRGIAPSPMPTPAPIEVGQAAIAHVGPTTTSWLDGWLGSTGITKPPLQVRYN